MPPGDPATTVVIFELEGPGHRDRDVLGLVDRTHPALADDPQDPVAAGLRAWAPGAEARPGRGAESVASAASVGSSSGGPADVRVTSSDMHCSARTAGPGGNPIAGGPSSSGSWTPDSCSRIRDGSTIQRLPRVLCLSTATASASAIDRRTRGMLFPSRERSSRPPASRTCSAAAARPPAHRDQRRVAQGHARRRGLGRDLGRVARRRVVGRMSFAVALALFRWT